MTTQNKNTFKGVVTDKAWIKEFENTTTSDALFRLLRQELNITEIVIPRLVWIRTGQMVPLDSKITKIIANNVTIIDKYAMAGAANLEIFEGASLRKVKEGAFVACLSLHTMITPNLKSVFYNAFGNTPNLLDTPESTDYDW